MRKRVDVEREADELKYSQYNGIVSSRTVKVDSSDNSIGSSDRRGNESNRNVSLEEKQIMSKNNSERIQMEIRSKPKD